MASAPATEREETALRPATPLTVIVPVFNEERTVDQVLLRLRNGPYPEKEVIVVDDGSTDGTAACLRRWTNEPGFVLLRHERNTGKGAAVRTALGRASGEITIIQDGDLEYSPADFPRLVEILLRGDADVVYGSRYLRPEAPLPWTRFRVAVAMLNGLVWLLYGRRLTDQATCYKAFRTATLRSFHLRACRFELCAEMTAKACRSGLRLVEVPIHYEPRSFAAGKKIGWRDAWQSAWTLFKWRWLSWTEA